MDKRSVLKAAIRHVEQERQTNPLFGDKMVVNAEKVGLLVAHLRAIDRFPYAEFEHAYVVLHDRLFAIMLDDPHEFGKLCGWVYASMTYPKMA